MIIKAFKAGASTHGHVTESTPRKAAETFFTRYPKARKCNVFEGELEGIFFIQKIGRTDRPRWWKDVTKKTLPELPETADVNPA